MRSIILLTTLLLLAIPASAQAPPTVYESPDIPPQAMDFDAENNRFVAHSGWIDDRLIHYYKFRMYVPSNYGTDAGVEKVPVAPAYLPSTDGTFAGVPNGQGPILEFHTADGAAYSDFVQIFFVEVPGDYAPNSHRSVEAIAGMKITATDIVVNLPVVPTGSTLEDPAALGTDAPIDPWMGWYKGDPVQTFVFESTSQSFADFINPLTRPAGAPGDGYESVVSQFGTTSGISAIPIWHVNQYQTGVIEGINNGGPSPVGQRNVIDKDRLDAGYSPLWRVYWATQVPTGYGADQASSADQFTEANGFKIAMTPMYVNCPNIGPHGGTTQNAAKASFADHDDVQDMASIPIEGSIPMREGAEVTVAVNGKAVDTVTTGMMGLYTYTLDASLLKAGPNTVTFQSDAHDFLATYTFSNGEVPERFDPTAILVLIGVVAIVFLVARYGA